MTATKADVERAVSARPGPGPPKRPGLGRRRPRAVTPLVQGLRSRRRDSGPGGGLARESTPDFRGARERSCAGVVVRGGPNRGGGPEAGLQLYTCHP